MNDNNDFILFMQECGLTPEQLLEAKERVIFEAREQEGLCVKASPIEGLGIFASRDFGEGEIIGSLTHDGPWILLGRYANHSPCPNAEVMDCFGTLFCAAPSRISKGDEITINYRAVRSFLMKTNKPMNVKTEAQEPACVNT